MKMLPRLKPTASGSVVVPTKIREHDHKIKHEGAKRDRGCGLVLQTLTGLKILWKGQALDKMLLEVTKGCRKSSEGSYCRAEHRWR